MLRLGTRRGGGTSLGETRGVLVRACPLSTPSSQRKVNSEPLSNWQTSDIDMGSYKAGSDRGFQFHGGVVGYDAKTVPMAT